MNWKIYLTDHARKQARKIPVFDLARINKTIDNLEINPFAGDIQKLEGEENVWRRRIGNYRITYEVMISQKKVFIYEIKRRTSSTY